MQPDTQEIYRKTILPLPKKEQLKLASMILERVTRNGEDSRPDELGSVEHNLALENLMQHAGAVRSGNLNSGDNDQIDIDLAGEYGKGL